MVKVKDTLLADPSRCLARLWLVARAALFLHLKFSTPCPTPRPTITRLWRLESSPAFLEIHIGRNEVVGATTFV